METTTINKILAFSIITIFTIGLTGYLAYSTGDQTNQQRLQEAAPYQTSNNIIGEDFAMKMVSHTEYWTGETGRIAVRLINAAGTPITVDNCTADIVYPDNTAYTTLALMNTSLINGNHYLDFTVPTPEGVYEYSATCTWNSGARTQTASSSFHVSPALNFQKTLNTTLNQMNNTLTNTYNQTLQIYNDTQHIRNNLVTAGDFQNNMTQIQNNYNTLQANISALYNYCGSTETTNAALCAYIQEINNTLTNAKDYTTELAEINTTTQNTYTHLTTTLATNINLLLGRTQDINATVHRLETNLASLNDTTIQTQTDIREVNQTLTNTQNTVENTYDLLNDTVTMTVSSG